MSRAPDVDYTATSLRPHWSSLPPALHESLTVALGTDIEHVSDPVTSGFTGGFAARAELADGRRVFIKAAPEGLHAYDAYQREAEVVPQLPPPVHAPRIITTAHTPHPEGTSRAREEQQEPGATPDPANPAKPLSPANPATPANPLNPAGAGGAAMSAGAARSARSGVGGGGWFAVVSEWVDGRMPGAPWTVDDFARVTAACERTAEVMRPSPLAGLKRFVDLVAEDVGVPAEVLADERELPAGLQAWVPQVLPELVELVQLAPEALAGDTATHSDLRPDNLLIDDGGTCWTIDWNWLTLGPAWVDWVGLLPVAQYQGIDTFTAITRSPLTADVPDDHLDCFAAVIAAYMMKNADAPPPPGCTPALRDHQRLYAWTFLDWLAVRRRWHTVDV